MELLILHVPGCPGLALLNRRLAPLLAGRDDIRVTRRAVRTGREARETGMAGSPALLADGCDLFGRAGQEPSLSCRRYPDEDGRPGLAPTAGQLRMLLGGPLNSPGANAAIPAP